MEIKYKPGIVDGILSKKLSGKGAVVIEGPNGVEKLPLQNKGPKV